mgnify:CR=1 FL=1
MHKNSYSRISFFKAKRYRKDNVLLWMFFKNTRPIAERAFVPLHFFYIVILNIIYLYPFNVFTDLRAVRTDILDGCGSSGAWNPRKAFYALEIVLDSIFDYMIPSFSCTNVEYHRTIFFFFFSCWLRAL